MPVAIGISGVLILVLNALPWRARRDDLGALAIVVRRVDVVALRLYRAYGPALVDALRRRRLLDPEASLEATSGRPRSARRLLVSADRRDGAAGSVTSSRRSRRRGSSPSCVAR